MKRHIILVMCALLVIMMAFVACKGDPFDTHEHTFDDTWAVDATNHWHAATCNDNEDCKAAKVSVAEHADKDNNKVCDVCGYDYDHAHTYATEWSSDENGHWYAVACGCTIDVKDMTAHTDVDNDGACDVCAYDGGHEHEYITDAWATDETNHWHAATCSHSVKLDEEAHDFDDMDRCVVCGYIKGTIDVEKAVQMGQYYESLVNGGEIIFAEDPGSDAPTYKYTTFTLGQGYTMFNTKVPSWNTDETCYYSNATNGVFAVKEYLDWDGSEIVERLTNVPGGMLLGNAFDLIYYYDGGDEDVFYGVTDLVTSLYDRAKDDMLDSYIMQLDGTTYYVFSYETDLIIPEWGGDVVAYRITVSFTLGEGYNYEEVNVLSERYVYTNDIDPETYEPLDTYHQKNLFPNGVFEYAITQTTGNRPNENKYVAENVLMTDFEVYLPARNEDGSIKLDENWETVFETTPVKDGTIVAYPGEYFQILIKPLAPEGAIYDLDMVKVDGEDTWGSIYISATGKLPGEYNMVISTMLTEKNFVLEVKEPVLTELNPTVNDGGISISDIFYTATVGENGTTNLIVSALPNSGANGSFTATTDNGTLTLNADGTYTLTNATPGTYVITFTSTVNAEITATLTITVIEDTPELPPLVGSKFEITDGDWSAFATFGTDNILYFVDEGLFWDKGTGNYPYTYDAETGAITVEGINFTITQTSTGYTFYWMDEMMGQLPYEMIFVESVGGDTNPLIGNKFEITDGQYSSYLIFNADGTLVFENDTWGNGLFYGIDPGEYSYTIDADGNVTVNGIGFEITEGANGYTFFWADQMMGMPPYNMTLVSGTPDEGGNDGDHTVDGGLYVGGSYDYVIDFDYMSMSFQSQSLFPDFTAYTMEGNNIIFTFKPSPAASQCAAFTFVYDSVADTITVDMGGNTVVLYRE